MNRIAFTLAIEPKSLQKGGKRIRIVANPRRPGRFLPMHFSDAKAKAFKGAVAALCAPHRPASPMEGPLCLRATFVMPRPARLCRRADPAGRVWCDTRPDSTNLVKGLEDLLTDGRFWHDDNQVALQRIARQYAAKGESPCIEVEIETLGGAVE